MSALRRHLLRNVVLPGAAALSRTRFLDHYREMISLENAPHSRTLDVQRERLGSLLAAARGIEHWRTILDRVGLDALLSGRAHPEDLLPHLPVMEKSHLRSSLQTLVRDDVKRDGWQFSNSSGTTDRVTIVHDFARRDVLRASQMRAFRRVTGLEVGSSSVEIPPDSCNILCGFEDPGPAEFVPYIGYALRRGELFQSGTLANLRGRFERRVMYRQETLLPIEPAATNTLLATLDERIDSTRQHDPMVLRGLPHFLIWLSERARERGERFPSLKVMLPYGGLMSPVMAARCEAALGVPFRDVYGTSELGMISVACDHGSMHAFEDLYCLEVVDRDGAIVDDGQIGDLLVTDLSNRVMPLIRYRVGDLAALHRDRCACGREGLRLTIHGRSVERIDRPGVAPLAARELCDLVFSDRDVWNFRLDQRTATGFELTLVTTPGGSPDEGTLGRSIQERLELPAAPRIRVRPYVRPEGSGKYRMAAPVNGNGPSPVFGAA